MLTRFAQRILGALALMATRASTPGEPQQRRLRSALDVARDRYARGQISREEYEWLRRELSE